MLKTDFISRQDVHLCMHIWTEK